MIRLQRVGARRFNDLVERLGSSPSEDPLELLPLIVTTIELPSLNPVGGGEIGIAGTVNFATSQLFNPADSTADLHVLGVRYSASSAAIAAEGFHDTQLSSAGTESWLDRNIPGNPQGLVTSEDRLVIGTTLGTLELLADSPSDSRLAPNVILTPGTGWFVQLQVTAFVLRGTWLWREVPIIRT